MLRNSGTVGCCGIVSSLHLPTYGLGLWPAFRYQQYRSRAGNKPCISVHSSYFRMLRGFAGGRFPATTPAYYSLATLRAAVGSQICRSLQSVQYSCAQARSFASALSCMALPMSVLPCSITPLAAPRRSRTSLFWLSFDLPWSRVISTSIPTMALINVSM